MADLTKEHLQDTFLNVRKAYRLLYEYQSKVLEVMKYISSYIGYEFKGGYSKFSNNCPRDGQGKKRRKDRAYLTYWAWDWLNMYFYEFNFGDKKFKASKGDDFLILFCVFLVSDTGWFLDEDNFENVQTRVDLSTFKNADESSTQLIFVAYKMIEGKGGKLWGSGTNKSKGHWGWDGLVEKNHLVKENDEVFLSKRYPLENFIDEQHAKQQIDDFISHCRTNGIEIKPDEDKNKN